MDDLIDQIAEDLREALRKENNVKHVSEVLANVLVSAATMGGSYTYGTEAELADRAAVEEAALRFYMEGRD